ncbi:hypothetical protein [Selenomonas sp. AB3002]|uniref:hypothetical protein n=1 Tax=Selenomonas sp. AB3002 TaxID=1392502 RepID=UPI000B2A07B8
MENTHTLLAGQRFLLQEEEKFIQVLSGAVEVYAVTRTGEELSFRSAICWLWGRGRRPFCHGRVRRTVHPALRQGGHGVFLCPMEK